VLTIVDGQCDIDRLGDVRNWRGGQGLRLRAVGDHRHCGAPFPSAGICDPARSAAQLFQNLMALGHC
jgi:hypothetical protein